MATLQQLEYLDYDEEFTKTLGHEGLDDEDPFWQPQTAYTYPGPYQDRAYGPESASALSSPSPRRISLPPKSQLRSQLHQAPQGLQCSFDSTARIARNQRLDPLLEQNPLSQNLFILTPPHHPLQSLALPSSSPTTRISRRISSKRKHEPSHNVLTSFPDTLMSNTKVGSIQATMIRKRTEKMPVVQGIPLVPTHELPDRFRSLFSFQVFNAIQSKCFDSVYGSSDNLVISAPTGSGKTVVLELAICRLSTQARVEEPKIVYIAPTKSLCSERYRDWYSKFKNLGLECTEVTGDTDRIQRHILQRASVIVTTPEKWDSITRKWSDRSKLLQSIKLFLIDEVHILGDNRGATLEAVVSRIKSATSNVRFVAISATVPNSQDVAAWLGKNDSTAETHLPARIETFGEEFRPVRLQKHVIGITAFGNDFAFDEVCNEKLPSLISRYSNGKPILIFCSTRKSAESTAKMLSNLWIHASQRENLWPNAGLSLTVESGKLADSLAGGVAFHHAGLSISDRATVENAFSNLGIGVICCTSTLAMGVNLPCYLVIIKNTVSWQDSGIHEYSDLEIVQMLGRSGRPQYDQAAIAVIMTRNEKVPKYEKLVAGKEVLESCLHLNLVEYLNAEISLGTIRDMNDIRAWLSRTFFFVRISKNPAHYGVNDDIVGQNFEDRINGLCAQNIQVLQEANMVATGSLRCTAFGNAMARYGIKLSTMKSILGLPRQARISETLSVLVGAEELHEVRFRSGEKSLFKAINSLPGIKFPVPNDIGLASHKRSLIIQAELGGIEFPSDAHFKSQKIQYQLDTVSIFSNIHRVIRCIIDCQTHLNDGPATRYSLELGRSLGARVWENSPLQMKQISNIGPVATRRLIQGGITSITMLESAEAYRINSLLSKNPGFGEKIVASLSRFPKLRVSVRTLNKMSRNARNPILSFQVELGFLNESVPEFFNRKAVYVCFIAERSDGLLVDFKRMSAIQASRREINLSVEILDDKQFLTCYVACDEIVGTLQSAILEPSFSPQDFPIKRVEAGVALSISSKSTVVAQSLNESSSKGTNSLHETTGNQDRYSDSEIEDTDLLAAERDTFIPIEAFHVPIAPTQLDDSTSPDPTSTMIRGKNAQPQLLDNGRWACGHFCKNKAKCKHLCCQHGLAQPPGLRKFASRGRAAQVASLKSVKNTNISHSRQQPGQIRALDNGCVRPVATAEEMSNPSSKSAQISRKRRRDPLERLENLSRIEAGGTTFSFPPSKKARNKGSEKVSSKVSNELGPTQTACTSRCADQRSDDDEFSGDLPPIADLLRHLKQCTGSHLSSQPAKGGDSDN